MIGNSGLPGKRFRILEGPTRAEFAGLTLSSLGMAVELSRSTGDVSKLASSREEHASCNQKWIQELKFSFAKILLKTYHVKGESNEYILNGCPTESRAS